MRYRVKLGPVELTGAEWDRAFRLGDEHFQDAKRNRRKTRHGLKQTRPRFDICIGAAGELAFAKLQGLHWPAHSRMLHQKHTEADRDVPPYEVRTRTKTWMDLPIRATDPEAPYALMYWIEERTFESMGFLFKSQAGPYWGYSKDVPDPLFWVPKKALYSDLEYEEKDALPQPVDRFWKETGDRALVLRDNHGEFSRVLAAGITERRATLLSNQICEQIDGYRYYLEVTDDKR